MRKLPTILAAGFILITLWRVGQFAWERMNAGVLGVLFSILLGAGVYLSSYYTRDNITRQDGKIDKRDASVKLWAWICLVFFILVDAVFNLLETWLSVKPVTLEMQGTTALYGVFPTLAAGLCGALQGYVNKLPAKSKPVEKGPGILSAISVLIVDAINALRRRIKRNAAQDPKVSATHKRRSANHAADKKYVCPKCAENYANSSALANHTRWKHPKEAAIPVGSNGTSRH